MLHRHIAKPLYFFGRMPFEKFFVQSGRGPWKFWICVEIPAENHHKIDVFADIALRDDFVGAGAFDAMLNQYR